MAECGDISAPEQDEIIKLLEETSKKEVVVILAGKTGAGKTTLLQNMVGEDVDIVMSPDPTTDNVYSKRVKKNGKQLVIYDTPGLVGDEKQKKRALESWSEKLGDRHIDLLVCCVPVGGSSKFKEDGYPLIMQCLYKKFGSKIWEHCVVVYTFSNQALDRFQRKCGRENREQVNARYIEFIQQYSKCFQDELECLNIKDIKIKSIFEWERENNNQHPGEGIILGIPAGDMLEDRVLPGIKEDQIFDWTDAMMLYWFMKCDLGSLMSLIELMCGEKAKNNFKKILFGLIIGGGAAGLIIGGGARFEETLKAILVGALAGGAVGGVLGGLIGMALGTTVMRAAAKKITQKGSPKDDTKEEKTTK